MGEVGAAAQVLPLAMPVHAQGFITGDALDQFDLIRLTIALVMGDGARAVPDYRADGDLGIGPDFLHRTGHDVRAVVAHEFQRVGGILRGDDAKAVVGLHRDRQIAERTVDATGDCRLGQRFRDVRRHIRPRRAGRIGAGGSVGQGEGDVGHGISSLV